MAGRIRLMEGNNGTQNAKGECCDKKGTVMKKGDKGFTNDDARSLLLLNVRKGAAIRIFDSPDGDTGDDYTEIVVLKEVQEYCVGSFERTYTDDTVRVTYHPNNGLDGKVSRVTVH